MFWQYFLNKLFYLCITRYNEFMDKRDLTVIENKSMTEKSTGVEVVKKLQTNPIVKKFTEFHYEKVEKFTVRDLFKK